MFSYFLGSTQILNDHDNHKVESNEEIAAHLAKNLNKTVLKLYGSFLSEDGTLVDYKAMKSSEGFQDFASQTSHLKKVKFQRSQNSFDQ
jgi:hypothetical protein